MVGGGSDLDWSTIDHGRFLFYGGLFTIGVDIILYPLELVKTRVQVEAASRATLLEASGKAFRDVMRREGVQGLYKGFTLFTVGGLPSQGAYFYGYNWARQQLQDANAARSEGARVPLYAIDLAAGLFADVVATPLWTPVEVVSTRMQIQGPGVVQYNGTMHACAAIWRAEGVRGLFRGLSASIFAFGPASALWWAMYEGTNRNLVAWRSSLKSPATGAPHAEGTIEEGNNDGHAVWIDAVSGLVAGCASSILTNPLDIAKTRLQAQHCLLHEFQLEHTTAGGGGGSAAATSTAAGSGAEIAGSSAVQSMWRSLAVGAVPPPRRDQSERLKRVSSRIQAEIRESKGLRGANAATTMTAGGAVQNSAHLNAATVALPPRRKVAASGETIRGGGGSVPILEGSPPFKHVRLKAAAATAAARGSTFLPQKLPHAPRGGGPTPPLTVAPHGFVYRLAGSFVAHAHAHGVEGPKNPLAAAAAYIASGNASIGRVKVVAGTATPSMRAPRAVAATAAAPGTTVSGLVSGLLKWLPTLSSSAPYRASLSRDTATLTDAATSMLAEINAAEQRITQRALARGSATPHGGGGGLAGGASAAPTSVVLHRGMLGVLLHILRTDGPRALIRGLVPRMLMQGPASAATFVCYEQVKTLSKKEGGVGELRTMRE